MQAKTSRWTNLRELLGNLDLIGVAGVVALTLVMAFAVVLVIWLVESAPPSSLVMTGGPPGSLFAKQAEQYREILSRSGVKVVILPSQGSLENLKRLSDPAFKVDVGFVQGGLIQSGLAKDLDTHQLVSLGGIHHQPLLVFYRGQERITQLSGLNGRRLAIGPEGSGTRALSLELLKFNGIEPGGASILLDLDAEASAQALREGRVDAAFMMSDSTPVTLIRGLLRDQSNSIRLMSFDRSAAYIRRITYLNKLTLPEGSIDMGRSIPPKDVILLGSTVELIARKNLHPAISDLLLEAARELHGKASLLQNEGEFPAPVEREFRISDDAARYYKSGKSFLYRSLPFWLANLVNRFLVIVLPILVVIIPGLRIIPAFYNWRIQSRIMRWYGVLLELEQKVLTHQSSDNYESIMKRLDKVEQSVSRMRVPKMFGDKFYVLRQHIHYVREQVESIGKKSGTT
jgi:TRAP-type uncharacterized transport system substrate-binding protein